MTYFGYHASHEQFSPGALLRYTRAAEEAGFRLAMCSDHFRPWSEWQGESGFAWAWLGAALQATSLPFGCVTAPGYRYHPAIVAQACATLAEMFPGRFWIAVGSGEQLNEHITGEPWPRKAERNARLKECVDVIRALWAGECVTHMGRVVVEEARLYTLPATPPAIIGAALTPETAEWLGGWADGLITVNQPLDRLEAVVDAFRRGGGEGKALYLQAHLSYAATEEEAYRNAREQWSTNIFPSSVLADLRVPAQFDALAPVVGRAELEEALCISSSTEQYLAWLAGYMGLGFSHIYLHNVGRNQEAFIEHFGAHVLPELATV